MSTIAFIGVGNMGGPMARNLLKAQDQVRAFDVSPAAIKPIVDAGAKQAKTALEAVSGADVVVTMLPAGSHVRSVYLEDASILTAARKDALLIDCSTIDIDSARAALLEHPDAKVIAGGTTLVDLMKAGVESPAVVIDINRPLILGVR